MKEDDLYRELLARKVEGTFLTRVRPGRSLTIANLVTTTRSGGKRGILNPEQWVKSVS